MRSIRYRAAAAGLLAAVLAVGSTPLATDALAKPRAAHALIAGSGSSWAANAVNQWVADVAPGLSVVYTANGAAQGRKDYANKSNDFGVSDIPFLGADPTTGAPDTSLGRSFAYLPIASGGTAFPYHLEAGGKRIKNLRLSGRTVARIFTGQLTMWNDPAVTADNNGNALPAIPVVPVVRSEGAGVSTMFTRYLAKQFPSIWGPCNGGKAVQTEYFPVNCGRSSGNMRAQAGSDGVMNLIKSDNANGAIGIEEYSYPLAARYPSAKLLNSAGYYTLPTQYNVAVALTKATINNDRRSPNYLTQNLDRVYTNRDPRTYALSSYVYAIIPTAANDPRMTTEKRQTLADFLYFSICQGQSEIGPIGYSSLPVNLVQAGFSQIGKLKQADRRVDLAKRNVSTCHNPTFVAGHPEQNYLAKVAPQPPACDKVGAGLCAENLGTYNGSASGAREADRRARSAGIGNGGSSARGGATANGPTARTGPSSGAVAGPVSGPGAGTAAEVGSQQSNAGFGVDAATTTTLAAGDSSSTPVIVTVLAVLLFVAGLVGPVLLARRLSRGRAT